MFLSATCSDCQHEDLISYYNSQSRDKALQGFWEFTSDTTVFRYIRFNNIWFEDELGFSDSKWSVPDDEIFWYSSGNKIYFFHHAGQCEKFPSKEYSWTYEVRNDTLFSPDMKYPFAVRNYRVGYNK